MMIAKSMRVVLQPELRQRRKDAQLVDESGYRTFSLLGSLGHAPLLGGL
jgi:hypothetical protein